MQDGFVKGMAATVELGVGDCPGNGAAIIQVMHRAHRAGARLLVLPELCVTGATCGDLFAQETLLAGALTTLASIRDASRGLSLVVAVGLPLVVEGALYSCAALVLEGQLLGVVPKSRIHPREDGPFAPGPAPVRTITLLGEEVPFGGNLLFRCRELPQLTLGVELGRDLEGPIPCSSTLALAGATVLLNLSAGSEAVGRMERRRQLVEAQSAQCCCGYLYAGAGPGESSTDRVFGGHCLAAEHGRLLAESLPFGPGTAITDLDVQRLHHQRLRSPLAAPGQALPEVTVVPFSLPLIETTLTRQISPLPFIPAPEELDRRCAAVLDIQSQGLARRMRHLGRPVPVLGISGGLDSTLALVVVVRAMELLGRPADQVMAVSMPCFGTTHRTRSNAQAVCQALGVGFREIDITAAVVQHLKDIDHPGDVYDAAYENAQARERTQVLMDLANRLGGLVVGTGDLSELALGWATYNGDQMSMYGVNAAVPKTLVRHLVGYAAREAQAQGQDALAQILLDILDTPVSPELLPPKEGDITQKTEEVVGPYELHDFFLYYTLRWGFSPAKIHRMAVGAFAGTYDGAAIKGWLKVFYRRFFSQQFKRSCLPDGPQVGTVSLSPRGGWQMPSDATATLWLAQAEEL